MRCSWKQMVSASVVCTFCAAVGYAAVPKTLVFCSEASPEGFNPQFFTTGSTMDASAIPLYNRLVEFEPGSTKLVPALAQSWTVSPDGLRYTFTLRRGVKFHSSAKFKPGRDFNADDVLFSYQRMADPKHPFHNIAPGQTFAYFEDMGLANIVDKLEKIDDTTIRFTLKHPEAPFIADMAMDFASIMSAEYAQKMKAAGTPEIIDREPIGTGPFQLQSYQKDAIIRYKAFDFYWDGRPKIDNLIFAITPDASVRYAKLRAGECHVMAYPKPADIAQMKADPALSVSAQEGLNVGYIALNVEKKPFDNKLVRQALSMAIDKQAILHSVFHDGGGAAKNPIPPTLWSYNAKIKEYAYDPVKAKTLLSKAGYPNGVDVELWYLPVTRPYNPDGKRMAELIQSDWAKIGVRAKLVTYEWTEYRKRGKTGEQHAMMFGWAGDNGDPDNFFAPILSCDAVKGGGNVSRWCNKDFDALIQKAKLSVQQSERAKLYEKAQEIVHEEAPQIPIAHAIRYKAVRKEVLGFTMDPTSHHNFSKVDLKK